MKEPDSFTLAKAVIDGLGQALLVIDHERNLRLRNLRAQRLLQGAVLFREEHGRLRGATAAVESDLEEAIAGLHAREATHRTLRAAGGSIAFLKRLAIDGPDTLALVAVFERHDREPDASLAAMFRLTPAEARVAGRLAGGSTPKQIAMACQVSESTVRSQVQSVFEKVGVHRQADLVRMLLLASA